MAKMEKVIFRRNTFAMFGRGEVRDDKSVKRTHRDASR
ncbi:UNVERIFIED_CONTAM: hypothetical protein ABID98_004466 [Brevibacillus sp. OAP136]